MTEVEGLIRFWESVLVEYRFLMSPSIQAHIEATIKNLRRLQNAT